jgi:hypothetical protein
LIREETPSPLEKKKKLKVKDPEIIYKKIGLKIFNTFEKCLLFEDERDCMRDFKAEDPPKDESHSLIGGIESVLYERKLALYIHGYLEKDHVAEIILFQSGFDKFDLH